MEERHTYGVYPPPPPVKFVRGEGVRLYDENGNDYLDCSSGIAVNCLGHSHPHMVSSLKTALDGVWHLSNLFEIPGQKELAARLCANTFAEKVFFTNSGTEAIECAIKTARRYHHDRGQGERYNIITFEGAFHGRTLAAVNAGGQDKYLEGFGPRLPGFVQVAFDDIKALKDAIDENTAAILLEPVQGEGGIRPFSARFLQETRKLCDERGILLMLDEIQCGVGRSGKLFAHEFAGIEPDIMAIAKGIGGGFPLGACLARGEVAAGMVPGTHGSTYGGNPLAMAAGNAVLDVILEEGFLDNVNRKSGLFRQCLSELVDTYPDLLEDVRGTGLLLGVKAKVPNHELIAAMRDNRVLAVGAGDNVIRILPPLIISEEEIREVRERMAAAFEAYRSSQGKS